MMEKASYTFILDESTPIALSLWCISVVYCSALLPSLPDTALPSTPLPSSICLVTAAKGVAAEASGGVANSSKWEGDEV